MQNSTEWKILRMDICERIETLKKEKNAVILAHYYTLPEVQALADYIGDSYCLSKIAVGLKEQTIIFCGVSFMGESAKLLNPDKTVLMPDSTADCPMAHMAERETIRKMRETYEDLAVVCYINSTAELKSLSDVCVTSANAVKVVKTLPNKNIFFIPDKNLARYVAEQLPEKNIIINNGYCPIHEKMSVKEVENLKTQHKDAEILAHPECPEALLKYADYIGSTSGIINYVKHSGSKEFIVCTEIGVLYELKRQNPNKEFYFTETTPVCRDMKLITPQKVLEVLENGTGEVEVSESIRADAVKPLEEMLRLSK
ncbi:MAG: quinolinate synthase NadA [Ruminococcus sp.]